jgi:NADPH2:quinone reductase
MRAVRFREFGGADMAVIEEVERPAPGQGEVLVRVRAAGLNPVDAKILAGGFAGVTPPRTLGVDFAGEVEGTGERVFGSGPGFGARVDGAFATFVVAPRAALVPIPAGISFEQAAALGVVCLTADLCMERGAPRAGETMLVFGASGGVGALCVQLGRAAGAHVVAVVSSAEGAVRARALGASETLDRTRDDLAGRIGALGGGRGPDVVVDVVGGRFFELAASLLAPGGRLLSVGVTGGERARVELDLPPFYRKGAAILGVNTSPMGAAERGERLARMAARFATPGAAEGAPVPTSGGWSLSPPEVETMELARAPEALARVAAYRTGGKKLVLLP